MRYALVVVLLAACATQQPAARWYKNGATRDDFETDWGYCEAQAVGAPTRDANRIALVLVGCMNGRGWRLVDR